MKTDMRLWLYIDRQRFSPECSYEVMFYQGDTSELFSYFFVFKFYCLGFKYIMARIILLSITSRKMFIKLMKMSRFVAILYRNQLALNKMYPKKCWGRSIRSLGLRSSLLLHAGGWEIDHQDHQNHQIPRSIPGGGVGGGGGHAY